MRALGLDDLDADRLRELDDLYRTTRDVRVRTRAQMILLVVEQRLIVAAIVRESGETVRRWVHRYEAEGVDGLPDVPRSGKPAKTGAAIVSGWSNWCVGARVPWSCRSRYGPQPVWPTTWRRRRVCA